MSTALPISPSVQTKTAPAAVGSGMGNGLVASTDIQVGENVVYAKTPFVAVLDGERLGDICSGCFGKKQKGDKFNVYKRGDGKYQHQLKACKGCNVAKYCDRVSRCISCVYVYGL